MKKIFSAFIIIFGILSDQFLKFWVVSSFDLNETKEFIPKVMSLTYLKNYGAAWSILEGQQWIFNILTPLALAIAFYFLWKRYKILNYNLAISLIIAGALGNWIDRLRQGFVVDMFQTEFINFAIFNLADIYLFIGFSVLMLSILLEKEE
ncbi:MAG: signal peptidase II [Lactovum sp.]